VMDYKKHYLKLIERSPKLKFKDKDWRQQSPSWKNRDGFYREGHRIVPGCMGGRYTEENVAYLKPEEHYIAHQLLVKIYPGNSKLIYAASMMSVDRYGKRTNNKRYGWLHKKYIEESRRNLKGKRLSPATEFKKGIRYSPETEFKKGQLSWNSGKNDWLTDEHKEKIREGNRKRKGKPGPIRTKEWNENLSKSRKGKGLGVRNAMANPENRAKVGASKVGRRGFINDAGHKIMRMPGTEPEGYVRIKW